MAVSFPDLLVELAAADSRICGVASDAWAFLLPLHRRHPDRAFEVGIAEQNLIGVAAGLALRGKVPFAIGFNPFVTMRAFEQIRTGLAYGAHNVKVIGGHGSGISAAAWGPTHHATEEIALMRLIPTMTVVVPADAEQTESAVRAAASTEGLFYIALAWGRVDAAPRGLFELGKAITLRDGGDACLIAVGPIVAEVLGAAEILATRGIDARVLNMHTVKPIDQDAVLLAAAQTRGIVTVEEHSVVGGLGGAVAEVLADAGTATALRRIGLQDEFAVFGGDHEHFRSRLGLSAAAIADATCAHLAARK